MPNRTKMIGAMKRHKPGSFSPTKRQKPALTQTEELQRAIAAANKICGPRVLR